LSQLLLDLNFGHSNTLENFQAGPNQLVKDMVNQWTTNQGERFLYLWAPPGFGKSHLLQAAAHKLYKDQQQVYYLSLTQSDLTPDIIDNLDSFKYVCIDNVDVIAGQIEWEEKLFHLYNKLKDKKLSLFVSASAAPRSVKWKLADLGSRFSWGIVMRLTNLSDEDKLKAICDKAKERSLTLPTQVAKFLMVHYLRDTKSLFSALDVLDDAALRQKRKITVPFVKEIMEIS